MIKPCLGKWQTETTLDPSNLFFLSAWTLLSLLAKLVDLEYQKAICCFATHLKSVVVMC
jgi:hypothetical protein